jgi:hypothetical protein
MKKGLTDIIIVLDRSGSMSSVADDTIGGFNTFLETQQQLPGAAHLELRQFDDQHDVVFSKPVKEAPKLTRETFVPRGSTALLDAIGMAIMDTGQRLAKLPEAERPEHVIVCIITDGFENASMKFSRNQIFQMITLQRDIYKWAFTFIGTDQDAIAEAGNIGIPAMSALNYKKSHVGTMSAFAAASAGTQRVREGVTRSMNYTAAEQQAAKDEDEDANDPGNWKADWDVKP